MRDQDNEEAVKWYRRAAEQGDVEAQTKFGDCYFYGHGLPKDEADGLKWYRKAGDQGYASAQYCLAECDHHGHGVPQDSGSSNVVS